MSPPRGARLSLLAVAAPALAISACDGDPAQKQWDPGLRHVVLIQADTLRMDHLSVYGHDRPTTPLMEGRPWEIVEGYRTVGAWTLPSISSVMSAQEPHVNGIMTFRGPGTSVLPAGTTLADAFRAAGYQTRLRTGNNWFVKGYGTEEGFDDTLHIQQESYVGNLSELIDGALDGLDPSRPIFLVFQPMDAHGPYMPVPEDQGRWTGADFPFSYDEVIGEELITERWEAAGEEDRRLIEQEVGAVYDEQLPELDRAMDRLFGVLDRAGILEDALVVWAADHGEALGDDQLGFFGHDDHVWPAIGRVPLAWTGPDISPGRRACLGQSHDLAPTLLAWAGIDPLPGMGGIDLRAGCRDIARHAWYSPRSLDEAAVSTEGSWLAWSCLDRRWYAWDLTSGAPILVAPEALPDLAALQAELAALIDGIEGATPMRCAGRW